MKESRPLYHLKTDFDRELNPDLRGDRRRCFHCTTLTAQFLVEAGLYVIDWATLFDSVGLLRGLRFPPTMQLNIAQYCRKRQ